LPMAINCVVSPGKVAVAPAPAEGMMFNVGVAGVASNTIGSIAGRRRIIKLSCKSSY
jgi:hypothetical protein